MSDLYNERVRDADSLQRTSRQRPPYLNPEIGPGRPRPPELERSGIPAR
jgi:hypothetical protein